MQILMIIGFMIMFVAALWIIVKAFQESAVWGILCLLFGPAQLIFVILHWDEAKKPFLASLAGFVLAVVGIMAVGGSA